MMTADMATLAPYAGFRRLRLGYAGKIRTRTTGMILTVMLRLVHATFGTAGIVIRLRALEYAGGGGEKFIQHVDNLVFQIAELKGLPK